jgi:hypothetical protein
MSVYYYKGAKILAPFTITSNEPMYDVDTVSLKKQRASQNVQRWEISFNVIGEPDTQVDMFLAAVTGLENADTMVMPQMPSVDTAKTVSVDTIPVLVAGTANDTSLTLNGSGITGIIPKGTFFKFSNHGKVYVTTSEADLSGNPVVNFYPALRENVAIAQNFLIGDGAVFSYYTNIDNQTGITFTDGVLSNSGTITLVEAL